MAEVEWTEEVVEETMNGVEIILTRDEEEEGVVDGEVEMSDLAEDGGRKKKNRRVDMGEVVDVVFRNGEAERVAVIVCGPAGMARDVRNAVGRWVGKGRDAWFHEEGFGF
ncbi:hypothetical protein V494_06477 [Pseudogymnoascus sp. VKM F-4513 (FW-928)]|nr:hypothetical protein V494_06477 [Pseudogymnoascus sp. VKM F-4513 (FW-928)]